MCRCCVNLKTLEEVYQVKMLPPPPLQPRPIVYNYPVPTTASRGNNFAEIIQEVIAEQEDEYNHDADKRYHQEHPEVLEYGYVEETEDGHEVYADENGEEIYVANQI